MTHDKDKQDESFATQDESSAKISESPSEQDGSAAPQGASPASTGNPLWDGMRKAAFQLGVGVGTAQNWAKQAAASPAAQRAAQSAREVASTVSETVVPAAKHAAGTALDATDMLLHEIESKFDEASRASEVGRRPTQKEAAQHRTVWSPREEVDPVTGQTVVTEAYTVDETGKRSYVVTPESPNLLTATGRRIAGLVLILLGVPMLILPGPGMATIIAGLALLRGDAPSSEPLSVDFANDSGYDADTDDAADAAAGADGAGNDTDNAARQPDAGPSASAGANSSQSTNPNTKGDPLDA